MSLFILLVLIVFVYSDGIERGRQATVEECRDYDAGEPKQNEHEIQISVDLFGWLTVGSGVWISKCSIKCTPTVEVFRDGSSLPYHSFASIWCFGKGDAECTCGNLDLDGAASPAQSTNIALARCKNRRRVLQGHDINDVNYNLTQLTEKDLTHSELECFKNEACGKSLLGYEIGTLQDTTTTRRARCENFAGCTDEIFILFNNAANDNDCRCQGINSFEYINDGAGRTYAQAQQYCRDQYNSDLATIRDEHDLLIATSLIADGPSPWIGIWGDIRCVRAMSGSPHINNDVSCEDTLDAILCNGADSATNTNSEHRRLLRSFNIDSSNAERFILAAIVSSMLLLVFM